MNPFQRLIDSSLNKFQDGHKESSMMAETRLDLDFGNISVQEGPIQINVFPQNRDGRSLGQ
jgi:hypothetical protein